MPESALPAHLKGTLHWDWPWPLSKIPRAWTSFKWGAPECIADSLLSADMVRVPHSERRGDEFAPKPITSPGTWQFSYYPEAPWWAKLTGLAFYVAWSGERKADGKFRHFRLGARWDNVDDYVTILAIATRRFTGGDEQDTSTGEKK